MKQFYFAMRAAPAIAAVAALAWAPVAGAAAAAKHIPKPAAGEHRLSAKEIRELAKRELLWCDAYAPQNGTCTSITLIQLAPDGRLAETTALLLDAGEIQAYVGEVDDVKGDTVCSKVSTASTPVAFTVNGQPAPAEATTALRTYMAELMADFEGKTICQSFFRGADPNTLREEVTVDGKRRTDLETVYQLHDGHDGFSLRPRGGAETDAGQKT